MTNHRLKEYNNSAPSVLLAAPCIPLKQQTSGHSPQEGQPSGLSVFQFPGSLCSKQHLSQTGTSLRLGNLKWTSEKSFSPCKGKTQIIPQNPTALAVRTFHCPTYSQVQFLQESKRTKATELRGTDTGSGQEKLSLLPIPIYIPHIQQK